MIYFYDKNSLFVFKNFWDNNYFDTIMIEIYFCLCNFAE